MSVYDPGWPSEPKDSLIEAAAVAVHRRVFPSLECQRHQAWRWSDVLHVKSVKTSFANKGQNVVLFKKQLATGVKRNTVCGEMLEKLFGLLDNKTHGFIPRCLFEFPIASNQGVCETVFAVDSFPTRCSSKYREGFPETKVALPVQPLWAKSSFVDTVCGSAPNSNDLTIFDADIKTTSVTVTLSDKPHQRNRILLTYTRRKHSGPISQAPHQPPCQVLPAIRVYTVYVGPKCPRWNRESEYTVVCEYHPCFKYKP